MPTDATTSTTSMTGTTSTTSTRSRTAKSVISTATCSTWSRLFRDAVVLALPMSPLCREDCPGLCAECGAPLADAGPGHRHDEATDPRWAALKQLDDQATDQMDRHAGAIDLQEG